MTKAKSLFSGRSLEIVLMVMGILLLTIIFPAGIYMANTWNTLLTSDFEYSEIEETGDFVDQPIIDGATETERYATYNGTVVTAETVVWDTSAEWDAITIAGTGDNPALVLNINNTPADILRSTYTMMRIKVNQGKHLEYTIFAVKYDGVDVSKITCDTGVIANASDTVYWNWTPSELLEISTTLAPATTDEVYFQVEFVGNDTTNAIATADVIQFQMAWGKSSNPWTFSGYAILTGVGYIGALIFGFCAIASTPYFNPFGEGKPKRKKSGGGRKKSRKRRR